LIDKETKKGGNAHTISSKLAFTAFLEELSSNSHITRIAENNQELMLEALGISADDNLLTNIDLYRSIEFPNTIKKTNDLAPDNYTIILEGKNREALKSLLKSDLNTAKKSITQELKEFLISKLDNEINKATQYKNAKIRNLTNQISARKIYLLNSRADKIKSLKNSLKIAATLNITSPQKNIQDSPTYTRGTTLLKAEIENIENMSREDFIDDDLRSMEAQLTSLLENKLIEPLIQEKNRLLSYSNTLTFYNENFKTPRNPIAPQKFLIIIISIIAGLIIGFLIAAVRMSLD
jgi:LPS O-antigen subunit length determinant protein (WzzB/FepE family)